MPKAQEATAAWLEELKKSGSISEDEWKAFETAVANPKVNEYIGGSVLRQQDYNRAMNQLKADYDTKASEILAYEKELAQWRGNTEKSVSQVKAELTQARAEADRLRATGKAYGLTDDDLGTPVAPFTTPPGTDPNLNRKGDAPEFDPSGFLKRTEFEEIGAMYSLLPAEINDIVAEHVDLFGKQPKGMRQVVEQAMREKRSVRDVYEESFKVADKRTEIAEAQKEAEIKRRVEEEITRFRTENPQVRLPRPDASRSYVLRDNLSIPEDVPNAAHQQADAVSAALSHWNSMEHKTE